MTGAWDAILTETANLTQAWADHGYPIERLNDHGARDHGAIYYSRMWDRGYREGARQAIGYILGHQLHRFHDLTVPELISELRKGAGSIYYPIIHTIDPGENPQINVECPSDLVHPAGSLQPVTRDGYCLTCSYDHMGNTHQGDN